MSAAIIEPNETPAIVIPEREPPAQPFRGIAPFRFLDQPIFFGRMAESQRLLRLVTMFRGVLLFGDSGSGKSSLLNARFIPEAINDNFLPERIRVQPKQGAEIVIDRIAVRERGQPPFIPSNLTPPNDTSPRLVLSCEELREKINRPDVIGYPLLIFDQFEEFVTLFEVAPRTAADREEAAAAQDRLLNLLAEFLVASHAPVKILFAFREDYFTKLQKLFVRCRDLMDQSLRLLPPSVDELPLTIRGPFEKNPGMFAKTLPDAVCQQLEAELRERSSGGLQNPSEVQIAGLMLWMAPDPASLLAERKVQGLLEDFLVQQLEALPLAERASAVALLSCLVTDAGTRNIVSRSDLLGRVTASESVAEDAVASTLDALVENTGLVRQEYRDRTAFYQIISEFLIPWIRQQKAERSRIEAERTLVHERIEAAERLAREREAAEQKLALQAAEADRRRAEDLAKTLRKVRRGRAALAVLTVLLLCGWALAAWQTKQARNDRDEAEKATRQAQEDRDSAQQAEDAARTALEKNSVLGANAERRLLAAGRSLHEIRQTSQGLLELMNRMTPPAAESDRVAWTQLTRSLESTVQSSDTATRQVTTAIRSTKEEAAAISSAPGWSLYGKTDAAGAWGDERNFHGEVTPLAAPKAGDIIVADTFVNVRRLPSIYKPEEKAWRLTQLRGVIAKGQRIKVDEVQQVKSGPDDPVTRVWIYGEPAPEPSPTSTPASTTR